MLIYRTILGQTSRRQSKYSELIPPTRLARLRHTCRKAIAYAKVSYSLCMQARATVSRRRALDPPSDCTAIATVAPPCCQPSAAKGPKWGRPPLHSVRIWPGNTVATSFVGDILMILRR